MSIILKFCARNTSVTLTIPPKTYKHMLNVSPSSYGVVSLVLISIRIRLYKSKPYYRRQTIASLSFTFPQNITLVRTSSLEVPCRLIAYSRNAFCHLHTLLELHF